MKGTILWYDKEKELGIARTHQHKRILVSIYDVQNSNFLIAGDEIEMEIEDKIYALPQAITAISKISRYDKKITLIFGHCSFYKPQALKAKT